MIVAPGNLDGSSEYLQVFDVHVVLIKLDGEDTLSHIYRAVRRLDSTRQLLEEYTAEFRANPEFADKLLSAGESPRDKTLPAHEMGAWTMIGHLLLNLSETVTKG